MPCENASEKRGRILAVDDSAVIRLVLQAALEPLGYSVEVVDSGAAALRAADLESFDAVILDVDMPDMDGLAVGRALRCHHRARAAKIAMHTGVDEDEVRRGFDGYDAFLPKPCPADALGACVDRLVGARRGTTPSAPAMSAAA